MRVFGVGYVDKLDKLVSTFSVHIGRFAWHVVGLGLALALTLASFNLGAAEMLKFFSVWLPLSTKGKI